MNRMKKVAEVLSHVRNTSSTNSKQDILKRADEEEFRETLRDVLYYTYNPFLMYGLTDKTLQSTKISLMTYTVVTEDDIFDLLDKLAKNNINDSLRAMAKSLLVSIEDKEVREMVQGIMVKDLRLGVNSTTLNKVFGKYFIPTFEVQLAESFFKQKDGSLNGKEICITEKLDGFRIVYNPLQQKFFTRKGQEYEGLEHLIPELNDLCVAIGEDKLVNEDVVIDGELVHEPVDGLNSQELYALTSSAARKKGKHKDKLKLQFNVFDFVPVNEFMSGLTTLKYKSRRIIMDKVFASLKGLKHVKPVNVFYMGLFDENVLMNTLQQVESWGGEGVMINLMDGVYECKRSKNLLKVKSFKDADVLVLDVVEGTKKNVGNLGAVLVQFLYDGKPMTCEVGSGWYDSERSFYWRNPEKIIGKIIEIKYFEVTKNKKDETQYSLRFATYTHRIREDKDENDITDVEKN